MNLRVIITFFTLAVTVFSGFSQAHAAEQIEPATHVWINSGSSTIYAAVSSKKGCEILTQQASMLNSATGHCYLKEQFLEEINCLKSLQLGDTPSCKMNEKPTR